MVSEPTHRGLWAGSAACFICSKPTSRGISARSSFFFTVSKPSSRGLSAGVYRLFIRLGTYFQGSMSGVQSVYKLGFSAYLQGTVCLGGAFLYGF